MCRPVTPSPVCISVNRNAQGRLGHDLCADNASASTLRRVRVTTHYASVPIVGVGHSALRTRPVTVSNRATADRPIPNETTASENALTVDIPVIE